MCAKYCCIKICFFTSITCFMQADNIDTDDACTKCWTLYLYDQLTLTFKKITFTYGSKLYGIPLILYSVLCTTLLRYPY